VREYEITVIFQPHLDDEARSELIERVSDWLVPNASDEEKPIQHHWGQRQLAYDIKNHTEGYYVLYEAKVDPARIADIERNMQYSEDILRYLAIRKEQ
jgi:small subunit ribosomal protein S6